jgi:serine/threonine protein kinase
MFVGTVPFKGTNPMKVYADIKSRNIQWPEQEKLEKKMSKEAYHLIDCMI